MKVKNFLLIGYLVVFLSGCTERTCKRDNKTERDFLPPPRAQIIPDTMTEFGNMRVDNYFWMKDRKNPAVMEYLMAENKYCDTVMVHTIKLQEKLYTEMRGRIKEVDQSVPVYDNGYYYYQRTEKDMQYPIYCRKRGSLTADEELLFDVNDMAEGSPAFLFAGYEVSDDNKMAAYMYNTTGSYAEFILKFRDLTTNEDLIHQIESVQNFTWCGNNKSVFYIVANESLRPYRVYLHTVNNTGRDKMVYEEKDELFNLYVSRSKSKDFIYFISASFTTTEYRFIKADEPWSEMKLFRPRRKEVEYYAEHHKEKIFISYKNTANINSKIYEAPLTGYQDSASWKEVLGHNKMVKIQDMEVFEKYLALYVRKDGLDGLEIVDIATGNKKSVEFPEPVYVIDIMSAPEYSSLKFRYSYSSLNRPATVYDYNMATGETEKLKEQEIPSGFNANDYVVERLWADSHDGTKVPVALVYRKNLKKNGKNPALLYGYGSYGYNTDAYFRSTVFSLVDRGFVYALAQVRGGSEMGEQWYEDGKLMKKMNTFLDFIACAEYLINENYTNPSCLSIQGGSAGGLLVGAVANMRPDLFNTVIAEVPFVDVINTMQDKSLPLTTQEYEQWGNPADEQAYRYILSYSPYDNVKEQPYPSILATTGWNDSQVQYHEPAKWVAKLRTNKTSDNLLLLKTNLESGHGGATGRFDYLKDIAFNYAFILDRMGINHE
ncbi:MAG: S9 family peptidase [Bacteroidales bacterium]